MNPFVKSTMKEEFPTTYPNDEYAVSQRELAEILEPLEEKMKAVKADLEAAQEQQEKAFRDLVKKPGVESIRSIGQARSKVGKHRKELVALDKEHKEVLKAPRPQERWVRECRKAFRAIRCASL
eukprot:IDg3618t1